MAIVNFIQTVWGEKLLDSTDKKYVGVANCSREYEGDIKEAGSTVKICGVSEGITVSDYTKNSDINEPEILTDSVRMLKINQAKYFNFQIDDVDKAQSSNKLLDNAMSVASDALANAADAHVYSLYVDAINEITDSTPTSATITDHIVEAIAKLMKDSPANLDEVSIEVSPEVAELLLKSNVLGDFDTYESGLIGKFHGCRVYVSKNIYVDESGYHKCFVRTKRAITFAESLNVETYRPDKKFATGVKGLHLYGAKIVYPDEFVVLNLKLGA